MSTLRGVVATAAAAMKARSPQQVRHTALVTFSVC
jgi:hypothetical protein